MPAIEGHQAGADVVKERLRDAAELGIRELTVFSFSTENWQRPQEEVDGLMAMFSERIDRETPELDAEGVRMRFIGRRDGVPADLVERMEWAEEHRRQRTDHALRGVQLRRPGGDRRRGAVVRGRLEDEFRDHLYAPEMHDPDLLIRTSGEQRISNFLLWRCAYSSSYFATSSGPTSPGGLRGGAGGVRDRARRFGGALSVEGRPPDTDTQPFDAELDFERPRGAGSPPRRRCSRNPARTRDAGRRRRARRPSPGSRGRCPGSRSGPRS